MRAGRDDPVARAELHRRIFPALPAEPAHARGSPCDPVQSNSCRSGGGCTRSAAAPAATKSPISPSSRASPGPSASRYAPKGRCCTPSESARSLCNRCRARATLVAELGDRDPPAMPRRSARQAPWRHPLHGHCDPARPRWLHLPSRANRPGFAQGFERLRVRVARTQQRLGVYFPVAAVVDDPRLGADNQALCLRYRMGHRQELQIKLCYLKASAWGNRVQGERLGLLGLAEFAPQ